MTSYTLILCLEGHDTPTPEVLSGSRQDVEARLKELTDIGIELNQVETWGAVSLGDYMIIAGDVCKPGRWGQVVSEYHGYLSRLQASFRIGSYRNIQSAIDRMTPAEAHDWFRWLQQVKGNLDSESRSYRPFPGGPKVRF